MKLYFRKLGEGNPIVVLHGIFGTGDNWQTLAKEWSVTNSVYLVDLRNHGLSPHHPDFDYPTMSHDILELCKEEIKEKIVLVGHSMGGKVAMHVACNYPTICRGLVVIDIAPKAYPLHHQHIFEGFFSVPLELLTSRQEADRIMSQRIPDIQTRQFLLKNLYRDSQGNFSWKLNLKIIYEKIQEVGHALPPNYKYEGPSIFIKGLNSTYILDSDESLIEHHFPTATLSKIENAGHWVHVERPEKLSEIILNFLTNVR